MDFSTLVLLSITIAMSGMQSTLVSAIPVPQVYYPNRVGYPGPYGPGIGPGIYGNGIGVSDSLIIPEASNVLTFFFVHRLLSSLMVMESMVDLV
jgi:hypothetical protein